VNFKEWLLYLENLFNLDHSKFISIGGKEYPAVEANALKAGMVYWDGSIITAVSPKGNTQTSFTLENESGSVERRVRNNSLIGLQGDVKKPLQKEPEYKAVIDSPNRLKEDAKLFKRALALKDKLTDLKVALTDGKISKSQFHSQHVTLKPQFDNVMDEIAKIRERDKYEI